MLISWLLTTVLLASPAVCVVLAACRPGCVMLQLSAALTQPRLGQLFFLCRVSLFLLQTGRMLETFFGAEERVTLWTECKMKTVPNTRTILGGCCWQWLPKQSHEPSLLTSARTVSYAPCWHILFQFRKKYLKEKANHEIPSPIKWISNMLPCIQLKSMFWHNNFLITMETLWGFFLMSHKLWSKSNL